MNKQEFETLVGKKVTWKTYQKWEAVYMDCAEEKREFCRIVRRLVKADIPVTESKIYAAAVNINSRNPALVYQLYKLLYVDAETGRRILRLIPGYTNDVRDAEILTDKEMNACKVVCKD